MCANKLSIKGTRFIIVGACLLLIGACVSFLVFNSLLEQRYRGPILGFESWLRLVTSPSEWAATVQKRVSSSGEGSGAHVRSHSLCVIAKVSEKQGNLDQAESLYKKAVALEYSGKFSYIDAYFEAIEPYADFLWHHNQQKAAMALLQGFHEHCKKMLEPRRLRLAQDMLAKGYSTLGMKEEAEALYKDDVKLADKEETKEGLALWSVSSRLKLANFLSEEAKNQEAEHIFNEALALAKIESSRLTNEGLLNGSLHYIGLPQEANSKIADLLKTQLPNYDLARVYEDFGDYCIKCNRYSEAENFYPKAISIWQQNIKLGFLGLIKGESPWWLNLKLADCFAAEGKLAQALPLYERLLKLASACASERIVSKDALNVKDQDKIITHYASCLRKGGQITQAQKLEKLASEIENRYRNSSKLKRPANTKNINE